MCKINRKVVDHNIKILKLIQGWDNEKLALLLGISPYTLADKRRTGYWLLTEALILAKYAKCTVEEFFLKEIVPNGTKN